MSLLTKAKTITLKGNLQKQITPFLNHLLTYYIPNTLRKHPTTRYYLCYALIFVGKQNQITLINIKQVFIDFRLLFSLSKVYYLAVRKLS